MSIELKFESRTLSPKHSFELFLGTEKISTKSFEEEGRPLGGTLNTSHSKSPDTMFVGSG